MKTQNDVAVDWRPSHWVAFWRRVRVDSGFKCWEWTGLVDQGGYGRLSLREKGRVRSECAHRLAWRLAYGPIPDGLCVCHRCDNRRCVRIDHLFLGTPKDNTRDMIQKGRKAEYRPPLKLLCKRGHLLAGDNLYVLKNGARGCRACRSVRVKTDQYRTTARIRARRYRQRHASLGLAESITPTERSRNAS